MIVIRIVPPIVRLDCFDTVAACVLKASPDVPEKNLQKQGTGGLAAHQFNVIVTSNMRMFRSLPVIQSGDVTLSAVMHTSINVTCPIGNLGGGEKEVLAWG